MDRPQREKPPNGFTLIEVMIVVAIIAILAAIAIPNILDAQCSAASEKVTKVITTCTTAIIGASSATTAVTDCLTQAQKAMDDLYKNNRSWWDKHEHAILEEAKEANAEVEALIGRDPEDKDKLEKAKLKNPADGQVVK